MIIEFLEGGVIHFPDNFLDKNLAKNLHGNVFFYGCF